jgi:hypothetical protein
MRGHVRHTVAPTYAAAVAVSLLCAQFAFARAASAQTVAPLPESNYSVRSACRAPAPGHASCMALELVPETEAARAHERPLAMPRAVPARAGAATEVCKPPTAAEGCFGLTPKDLHSAYDLPDDEESSSSPPTVAVIDAYNDPTLEANLKTYDQEYGFSECTTEDGCLEKLNEHGEAGNFPFPKTTAELESRREGDETERDEAEEAEGWTVEESLDVETVRATCQNCKILLVEAETTSDTQLEAAEETAERYGAKEISNSWGTPECESSGLCITEGAVFDDPGTVITASAGDYGYLDWDSLDAGYTDYPASSPNVVAVGGTRLRLSSAGAWEAETVWNDGGRDGGVDDGHGAGGGGCSEEFEAQLWQQHVSDWSSVGCGDRRAVADVSADADPYTGVAVYDTSAEECETEYRQSGVEHLVRWCTIGGTSLASPLVASVFALAGGAHGVSYPSRTLYENEVDTPGSLHDVTSGSNGECDRPFDSETAESGCTTAEEAASCSSHLICKAGTGYDGPSGVGTPDGITGFQPPSGSGGQDEEKSTGGDTSPSAPTVPAPVSSSGSSTTSSSSTSQASLTPLAASAPAARISGLALTFNALLALDADRPRIAQIGFTFDCNVATRVTVTLQKQGGKRGHTRWLTFVRPSSFFAASGHDTHRLGGHRSLGSGSYRLTLTLPDGSPRSIVFKIG